MIFLVVAYIVAAVLLPILAIGAYRDMFGGDR